MTATEESKNNTGRAIISTLLAFLFLAVVSVLIKLETLNAPIEWIVFIQYSSCLCISILIASRNKFKDLNTQKLKLHIVRGVTGILAFTCAVIAMTKIPLVNTVLLNNTAPIFIPIITLVWLKTKIDEKIWWGILIGFIGIIFILQPSSSDFLKPGNFYGLAAGVFLGIAYVALKILTKTESYVGVLFYYSLIATLLSLPFAISNWSNPPLRIWIYGVMSGILFLSYLFLLQYAYKFVEAVTLSPFNFSVIVFTGILDWLLFDHIPDVWSVVGIVLVSTGGILAITIHEKDNKQLKHHWHW